MESTVKERLTEFLNSKRINKTEFGKSIGVSSAYVTSMRKSIDVDKLKGISLCYPDLNILWLLLGEGEMLNTVPATSPAAPSSDKDRQQLLDVIASQQRTIEVQANLLSQFAQRESVSVPPAAPAASAAAAGQ